MLITLEAGTPLLLSSSKSAVAIPLPVASLHSIFVTYSVDGTISSDIICAYTTSLFVLVISVLSSDITVIIGDACKRWLKSSSATLDKLSRKLLAENSES